MDQEGRKKLKLMQNTNYYPLIKEKMDLVQKQLGRYLKVWDLCDAANTDQFKLFPNKLEPCIKSTFFDNVFKDAIEITPG